MQGRIFCRTYDMIKSRCFLDSDETKSIGIFRRDCQMI